MKLSKKTTLQIFKITSVVILLYILLKIILIPLITSPQFIDFTANLGFFGYFIVIGYTALSHVFAPLAGTPGVLLGTTVYGIKKGMFLLYIASLISAVINFWISRRFGRKLVLKLVGEKAMKEVDKFTSVEGKRVLLISRLFGFSIFEFISYAAGLTNISFKNYFIITVIANAFTNIAVFLLFRNVDFHSEAGIMIWIGSIIGTGIIFGLFIKSYLIRKKDL
ncbi:MAG: hypothetical protein COY80_00930 [Candidatus Pacebacteria bacterium CG_4_10_14_0_8_um_filter_42_14]|nr:MAG: hypothetical protein COY80_00930 [Candidatus Pacebacteria bacterium CG_4_10_14_0_8_um_filter_42_14]